MGARKILSNHVPKNILNCVSNNPEHQDEHVTRERLLPGVAGLGLLTGKPVVIHLSNGS